MEKLNTLSHDEACHTYQTIPYKNEIANLFWTSKLLHADINNKAISQDILAVLPTKYKNE